MKQTFTKLGGALFALLLLVTSSANATITATWDWKNNEPDGIRSISTIQNTTGTVASNVAGVTMFVDATSGKLGPNGDNAQFVAGTILHIPVVSTADVVTFTPHPSGYSGVTIGDDDYDDTSGTERTHTATAAEVQQGYVKITSKGGYLYGVKVDLAYMPATNTTLLIAWDWEHDSSIQSFTGAQYGSGIEETSIVVTVNDINYTLTADCTSAGKFGPNGGNPQFTSGAKLRVPVTTTTDVVRVKFHSYDFAGGTIGGTPYTTTSFEYKANSSDVAQGYVEIVSGGSYIYSVILEKLNFTTATIGSTGWATFSNTSATDFTNLAGVVAAYEVTGNTGSAITKNAVTTAAGSTGLMLNAEAGTYAIPLATTGTDLSTTNKLVAVASSTLVGAAPEGYTNFVLVGGSGTASFKKITGTNSATVGAGKAYLQLTGTSFESNLFFLDDDATAINAVKSNTVEKGTFYNLAGQRVENPAKGLYIVNGKKVVIK